MLLAWSRLMSEPHFGREAGGAADDRPRSHAAAVEVPGHTGRLFIRLEGIESTLLHAVVVVGFMLVCLTEVAWPAGVITPELQQVLQSVAPDEEVPVIVTLVDKVDVSRFQGEGEALRRAELLEALKSKAEATQAPLKTFLASRGVQRLRSLWVINGMALTARAKVILELAAQPGIESIRLDTALRVPQP